MAIPKNLHISQILYVATFNNDVDIRHKSGLLEKAFKNVVDAQATSTNIPDSFPPDLPRLTMKSGKKELAVTQQNIQLSLNFDKDTLSNEEHFNITEKYLRLFWNSYCILVDEFNRKDIGIVVVIREPSNNITNRLSETYEKFSKMPILGELASFEFKAGFKTDDVFKNFSIGLYEIRQQIFEQTSINPQQVYLNINQMTLEETGIEYKFDVNNRPSILNNGNYKTDGAEQILTGLKSLLFEDTKSLLNW